MPRIPPFPQLAYLCSGQEPAQLEARPCREKLTIFFRWKFGWENIIIVCNPNCPPLLRENWGERRGSQDQGFFGFELVSFSLWLLRPRWRRTSTFNLRSSTSVHEQNIKGLSKILNSLQNTFLPRCCSLIESFTSLQLRTIKSARTNQIHDSTLPLTTDRSSRAPGRAPAPWRATAALMEPLQKNCCQSLEKGSHEKMRQNLAGHVLFRNV